MRRISKREDYFIVENNKLVLGRKFKPLPVYLFSKVLNLFIFFSKRQLECLVYLNRDYQGNYVITVPKQIISSSQVKVQDTLNQVNIVNALPTLPLTRIGSFHSHHVMELSFSNEDDLSDFQQGAGFHYLMRCFPNIKIDCTAVYNSKRYDICVQDAITYNKEHVYTGLDVTLSKIIATQMYLK